MLFEDSFFYYRRCIMLTFICEICLLYFVAFFSSFFFIFQLVKFTLWKGEGLHIICRFTIVCVFVSFFSFI